MIEWAQRNKLIALLVVIWALSLVTWVTWRVFGIAPPVISAGTAAAFGSVIGLPALAVGLWKWKGRDKGDLPERDTQG